MDNGRQSANSSFNFLGVQRFNSFSTPFCSSSLVHGFPLTTERKAPVLSIIQQPRLKKKSRISFSKIYTQTPADLYHFCSYPQIAVSVASLNLREENTSD